MEYVDCSEIQLYDEKQNGEFWCVYVDEVMPRLLPQISNFHRTQS